MHADRCIHIPVHTRAKAQVEMEVWYREKGWGKEIERERDLQ